MVGIEAVETVRSERQEDAYLYVFNTQTLSLG